MSHPNCQTERGHICQKPSGRVCIEADCSEPAGTLWGPYWCPEHDQERIDRINVQLQALLAETKP